MSNDPSVDLSKFENAWYRPGPLPKRLLWMLCGAIFFDTAIPFPSFLKKALLAAFGAKVGRNVVLKPHVRIKYPWFLTVGDNVWIGESVWIDNLCQVTLGDNVCVSQGAFLLTGNHDYKSPSFDLMLGPITVEDGVWIGAKAVVCPGTHLKSHSVVTVGSVAAKTTEPCTIYSGNPAVPVRQRVLRRVQGSEEKDE